MTIQAKTADFLVSLSTSIHRSWWDSYAYQFSDTYANVAFHIGCVFISVLIFFKKSLKYQHFQLLPCGILYFVR